MRTCQSIGQPATGTTIRDVVNIGLYKRAIAQRVFRVDFISALLSNYYKFFYAVKMCFKSNNMLFIRAAYFV